MNIQPGNNPSLIKNHPAVSSETSTLNKEKSPTELRESNRVLENKIALHLAEHPAIKKTMHAITDSMVNLFLKVHGEKNGWANIIRIASPMEDTNPKGNSGVIKPYYGISGAVGWNGATIKSVKNHGRFTEKAAIYYLLMGSQELKSLSKEYRDSPELQKKLEGHVSSEAFNGFAQPKKNHKSWTSRISEFRQLDVRLSTRMAGELLEKGLITKKEQAFHQTNPINHPSEQDRIGFNIQPTSDDIKVAWAPGRNIWRVKANTEFSNRANEENKPTTAGVSGTTSRFMKSAGIIAPDVMKQLGIDDKISFNELLRALCYAYLLPFEHHSMLEINLAAAGYGLDEQWGDELYEKPFTKPIQGEGFQIDNDSIQPVIREHRNAY